MRFMDDESISGSKEFAVGNYLVQMVSWRIVSSEKYILEFEERRQVFSMRFSISGCLSR